MLIAISQTKTFIYIYISFFSNNMEKPQNLEKVVCELNSETKLPKHAMQISEKDRIFDVPNFYCCDSRRNECAYSLIHENKCYCTYKI